MPRRYYIISLIPAIPLNRPAGGTRDRHPAICHRRPPAHVAL